LTVARSMSVPSSNVTSIVRPVVGAWRRSKAWSEAREPARSAERQSVEERRRDAALSERPAARAR
jgi:hypothetical protein